MTDFRIEIRVDGATREQALEFLEKRLAQMKANGWPEMNEGGGGGGGKDGYRVGFNFYLGPRPMTDRERIERLEMLGGSGGGGAGTIINGPGTTRSGVISTVYVGVGKPAMDGQPS
jgi:hypothetical protein